MEKRILELYSNNGKENGNQNSIVIWGYIETVEKKMETLNRKS